MKASGPFRDAGHAARVRDGFTLLELCIVLLIIAVLLGAMIPAFHSAFEESSMRADARKLSLSVKTAMQQCVDEDRDYVLDLTGRGLDLRPAGSTTKTQVVAAASDADTDPDAGEIAYSFDRSDHLLVPDPDKPGVWVKLLDTTWIFQPGELCPATRVRLARGDAWLEMSFNALTGNVENETSYFP